MLSGLHIHVFFSGPTSHHHQPVRHALGDPGIISLGIGHNLLFDIRGPGLSGLRVRGCFGVMSLVWRAQHLYFQFIVNNQAFPMPVSSVCSKLCF